MDGGSNEWKCGAIIRLICSQLALIRKSIFSAVYLEIIQMNPFSIHYFFGWFFFEASFFVDQIW